MSNSVENPFADEDDDSTGGGPMTATIDHDRSPGHHPHRNNNTHSSAGNNPGILSEVWTSSELLFSNKITWLLILGPIALAGDSMGFLSEAACFAFSGIALIPCAERLSFVTEQVAEHTNGTIGALLNATFGNAPELLIATAALRSGFYRVVQLAMLGSMLTNLLFVFGISSMIGGFRWQVQELRLVSGNVSVGLLLLAVAGSLLPAALILGGQLRNEEEQPEDSDVPSKEELQFSRVNAFIMIIMYGCYLTFQLGTHKDEFDEEFHADHPGMHSSKARQNVFCLSAWARITRSEYRPGLPESSGHGVAGGDVELAARASSSRRTDQFPLLKEHGSNNGGAAPVAARSTLGDDGSDEGGSNNLLPQNETVAQRSYANGYFDEYNDGDSSRCRNSPNKSPGAMLPLGLADPTDSSAPQPSQPPASSPSTNGEAIMSFRVGIVWLFIITLCISAMSDILVDTIDGFAKKMRISEVFTTMVIVPFFSNVAEQVSAVIFAYRNEMDLCVGVTVGSAIQVATFVLPGCVIIGLFVDRSMTLYFHAYETVCLLLSVIVVAAVLQGGTTNWLVGATCVSIYVMMATGFWFHSLEELSVDEETLVGGG